MVMVRFDGFVFRSSNDTAKFPTKKITRGELSFMWPQRGAYFAVT